MKTTIDIPGPLLEKARQVARREDTTLRALVEQGLRAVLKSRRQRAFKLRRASFRGEGRQPSFEGASWQDLRDTIYEGRGS